MKKCFFLLSELKFFSFSQIISVRLKKTGKVISIAPPLVTRVGKYITLGEIIIGNNVWIGEGVAIFSGVTIGDNCVIGSNAVVNKSFPANSIIGGIPARLLR